MSDGPFDPGAAALPAELLQAFVAGSRDLLALTDAAATLLWVNARFSLSTGYNGRPATSLLDFTIPGAAGSEARLTLARMLSAAGPDSGVVQMRGPGGDGFWVDAHCARVGAGRIVWTLADVTQARALGSLAARREEMEGRSQELRCL